MRSLGLTALAGALIALAATADAHPVPFTYLDLRVGRTTIELSLVAHILDVGHDLRIEPATRLLDANVLRERQQAIAALIAARLSVSSDGRLLVAEGWIEPEPLEERQSIRLRARYTTGGPAGVLAIRASLFPYDPQHRTFVNVYEGDEIATQAILETGRASVEHFTGSRQGTFAVVRRFVASGVHHILIGPDHLLFLIGLLLLGGTVRQLVLVVSAFTLAHSLTLSLAALDLFSPPARVIEPAIALTIVYVGADNLMVRGGRDVRTWLAFTFGFIHGFGFANVLRDMDLPRQALGWSLFSFNLGVEIGQLAVVIVVASAFAALRARSARAGRVLAVAGSAAVMAAGAYWFIERVFFPGGIL